MLKSQLATKLRQRQYNFGMVDKQTIDLLTDDQIIDSYITCSCCGDKQVDEIQLPRIIEQSHDVDDFFEFCDSVARAKALVVKATEDILKKKNF
jgi:Cys-tRNA synthase (O-phospho-L-seryl-tRNA:Cys-tRNA synthase)